MVSVTTLTRTLPLTLTKAWRTQATIADQLSAYIAGFSPARRDVIEKFDFHTQIARLNRSNLLYLVLSSSATSTSIRTRSPTSRWATSTRS